MSNRITKAELLPSAPILANPCYVRPFSCRLDAVSEVYNMDCVEGLKHYPNKYFDLAICDPPYGIGESGKSIAAVPEIKAMQLNSKLF